MFALVGFLAVFFQVDGDEDELEVGEGSLVEPVVAGGGPTVVLHAFEDAFDHVPPLVRHAPLKRPCSRPGSYQRSSGVPIPGDNTPPGSSTTGRESHTGTGDLASTIGTYQTR